MKNLELLVILCKYPTPGNCKTRLGKKIGNKNASIISQSLLLDVIEIHKNQRYSLIVVASEHDRKYKADFKRLIPELPIYFFKGDNLRGENSILWEIFSVFLNEFEKVIVLYSDVPFIDNTHIHEAFQMLTTTDLVIGPDTSNGYFLIGLKDPTNLFSTLSAERGPYLAETLQNAQQHKLKYILLEPHTDVDELEDIFKIEWDSKEDWNRTRENLYKLGLIL